MPEDREGASKPALFAENSDLRFRAFVGRGSMGTVYRAFRRKRRSERSPSRPSRNRTPKQVIGAEGRSSGCWREIVHPNLVHLYELVDEAGRLLFHHGVRGGLDFVEARAR